METIPDSTQSIRHTTNTRSASRRERKSQHGTVSDENDVSNEFASKQAGIVPMAKYFLGDLVQNTKCGLDSNVQERTESSLKKRRAKRFKSSTKKRLRVDTAASLLSRLNERAYRRYLLKDADSVNQKVVLPMALPWMHVTVPVTKSIPFDIDEMPDVLAAGERGYLPVSPMSSSVDESEKKTTHYVATRTPSFRPLAQRSSDPGVIDLAFTTKSTDELNLVCPSKGKIISFRLRKGHPGEIALNGFEIEHLLKRSQCNLSDAIIRRKQLSVRIASSSSKAAVLPPNLSRHLAARLPAEVQDGRFLSMKRAKVIAKRLGSYDCRHGLPPTNPSGKNANRVTVGRTRRMWTSKSPPDKPQRVFFTSLLTARKLESGAQRRPRDIQLAIKINGEYYACENSLKSLPGAETSWGTKRPKKQCVVNPSKYINMLLSHVGCNKNDVGSCQENQSGKQGVAFRGPQLECLPDNAGIVSVCCMLPGNISVPSLHETLNSAAQQKSERCTVCWATGSSELGGVLTCSVCGLLAHMECCMDAGESLQILRGGAISTKWTCAVCCAGHKHGHHNAHDLTCRTTENQGASRRPSRWAESGFLQKDSPLGKPTLEVAKTGHPASFYHRNCALCPYSGGAMSQISIGDTRQWVHEVCRIWTNATLVPKTHPLPNCHRSTICALCGTGEANPCDQHLFRATKSLIKCAASNCLVQFHPMCALLASKLQNLAPRASKINHDKNEVTSDIREKLLQDRVLAGFTLNTMQLEATGASMGNKYSKMPNRIPVCFCSFHHPSRDASLYGLYPGGTRSIEEQVVEVPSLPIQL